MLSSLRRPRQTIRPLRVMGQLGLGLLFCLAALSTARAAEDRPRDAQTLRDYLFRSHPDDGRTLDAPIIARFALEDGDGFVLDRSQDPPLLRFDDHREVWVLSASRAARGDIIYKNDTGRQVLRATQTGGLTLFTLERPTGMAVALEGRAQPIRIVTPISPNGLLLRLAQASARASRVAQRLIPFDANAGEVTPLSSFLYADAAAIAADAVVQISKRPDSRSLMAKLGRIQLIEGRRVEVRQKGPDLQITIVIDDGLAGRPSSERIVKALDR